MSESDRLEIDWGEIAPLRLRARSIADGLYAGAHRSIRRGPGVEFGGHRPYLPGDDLRWLDRRAVLRHGKLIIRQFETETDRGLRLVMDASASMAFRSRHAPASKFAYAALLASAVARIAWSSGDPVGLGWLGGDGARPLPAMSGRESFDRVVFALESVRAQGDLSASPGSIDAPFAALMRRARRGNVAVLFSDLIDLPTAVLDRLMALTGAGLHVGVVQVLDPEEMEFPYEGTVRLQALEGHVVVEANARDTRARYLAALRELQESWSSRLLSRGGFLLTASTASPPERVVRQLVSHLSGDAVGKGVST